MIPPPDILPDSMAAVLRKLIDALRHELEQYGEMLARLDLQQELIMRRVADDLLQVVSDIQEHGLVVQSARRHRESCRAEIALALALGEAASFQEIIPRLPRDYRPLVGALVQENNELLVRVQQRSRQNHLLLSRTVDLMQRFINSLFPTPSTPVYNGAGKSSGPSFPSQPLYEAVG